MTLKGGGKKGGEGGGEKYNKLYGGGEKILKSHMI